MSAAAARWQRLAIGIHQACAECLDEARAAVGARAAAEAEHDAGAAGVQGGGDELSGADRC